MQRDNPTWIADLRAGGLQQEQALADLREVLLKILPKALSRWIPPSSPHFDSFMEDITQETLLRVLDRLDSFEGRSKFTTWVYTIAIRIGLSELRLRKWQETSLDQLEATDPEDQNPYIRFESATPTPETSLARKQAVTRVIEAIQSELTPHQRAVMTAVIFKEIPLDVLAKRMETNRNALYKTMHDARVKLKNYLEQQGAAPDHLLNTLQ